MIDTIPHPPDSGSALPEPVFEECLELLRELTAISSPSGDRAGLDAAAACLGRALDARGLDVEIRPRGEAREPVLYARNGRCERDYLLLVGHLDTVLTALEPRLEGDRLWATGAADMKGGLAALVGALELLEHRAVAIPQDLMLVVVPDEEVVGELSHRVMIELGPAARGLWVLEPGRRVGQNHEQLVQERRGLFTWQLDVRGMGAHAGNDFWSGRSALEAANAWCGAVSALSSRGGPTVNVGRMVAGERDFVEQLADNASLLFTARQTNVVPDRARVEGEARTRSVVQARHLARRMEALAKDVAEAHGVSLDWSITQEIAPVAASEAGQRWADIASQLARQSGWTLSVEEDRGGVSFSNFLPWTHDSADQRVREHLAQMPILDGLGPAGGGMHTRDEFVDLGSLRRRIVLLADLLEAFSGAQLPGSARAAD